MINEDMKIRSEGNIDLKQYLSKFQQFNGRHKHKAGLRRPYETKALFQLLLTAISHNSQEICIFLFHFNSSSSNLPLRILLTTLTNFSGLRDCNPYGCQQSLDPTLAYSWGSFLVGILILPLSLLSRMTGHEGLTWACSLCCLNTTSLVRANHVSIVKANLRCSTNKQVYGGKVYKYS
jgi:hypothetical protein